MSLLWRDDYIAVLCPDRAMLVRRRRGWPSRFDLKVDAPTRSGGDGASTGTDRVADALASLLARQEISPGDLTILLSNHFARFQLLPWNEEVSSPDELAAFAKIHFEQIYGPEAAHWAIEISPEATGAPRLAAAVDAAFIARLRELTAGAKLRLKSIQPYLITTFNRFGRKFRRRDFVFVVAEPSRTCLLAATGGKWTGVRADAGNDSPESLSALIERESQLLGLNERNTPPIYVHAPQRARLSLPPVNGVAPTTLSIPVPATLSATADPQLAMAMSLA